MKKRYQTSETLPVGLLLALAGGFLDAGRADIGA